MIRMENENEDEEEEGRESQDSRHWGALRRIGLEGHLQQQTTRNGDADIVLFLPLQIKPVQKQTRAGQRTRFKAIVIIGDSEGHVGLGIKTSKEVATAIRAAIIIAKLSVIPVRRGYWGANLGLPHSLPVKESGKCGSVTVRVSYIRYLTFWSSNWVLTAVSTAYPRSPRYLPRCLPRRQASSPARRYRGCLHLLLRLYQDP